VAIDADRPCAVAVHGIVVEAPAEVVRDGEVWRRS
jgi:hypothetical protein